MNKRIAILAPALALSVSVAAQASRTGAWRLGNDSYHLYYDDLDVTTMSGRAILLDRVEAVAKKLCPMPTRIEQMACVREVIARIAKPEIARALAERSALAACPGSAADHGACGEQITHAR